MNKRHNVTAKKNFTSQTLNFFRNTALLSLIFFILQSCSSEPNQSDSENSLFFIRNTKNQFKHQNIKKFPRCGIKDLSGSAPSEEIHKSITGDLAYQIFQDGKYVSDTLTEGTRFLYSIQQTRGHQGILIGGMDDDWVNRLYYRSYDLQGKFVAELVIYECGGDGGYTTESFGKFINDSVYVRTTVNCELSDAVAGDVLCDSVSKRFLIHAKGTIEELRN